MKKTVLLGTICSVRENWLPYAVGCLISYCKTIPEINERYTFLDPIYEPKLLDEYTELLKDVDILGLTCYTWNQGYNDNLSEYFKKINPTGKVIYGGPQVPEDTESKKIFDKRPYLDFSIAGLGEIAFSEWLLNQPLSNKKLITMPQPYADGTFNNILARDKQFKVSFETNRGCPYSCSFCDWGGQAKSKITVFELNEIKKSLEAIYKHKNIKELEILDANFGIFKRDIEILDYMLELQKKNKNKLKISYSGLAKNGNKNLIPIMERLHSNFLIDQRNLKISFQTHTPEVLRIANRSNIRNDSLIPMITHFKQKNIPVTSEMIIAMPGETALSWLQTMHKNYHDLSIDFMRTYILHLVENTELYSTAFKSKYNVKTKKIKYLSNEVEIINSCFSFDYTELEKMFDYFFFFNTFVNTQVLKNKITNLFNDTLIFYKYIDNLPFIKQLLLDYRNIVYKIFKDETETELDKKETIFFTSTLRGTEIEKIIQHSDIVSKELESIYGPLNLNWECNDINKSICIIT